MRGSNPHTGSVNALLSQLSCTGNNTSYPGHVSAILYQLTRTGNQSPHPGSVSASLCQPHWTSIRGAGSTRTRAAAVQPPASGLNLVPRSQGWRAGVAASRGATGGRQDIPAQDQEMPATTCYAKAPRRGKENEEVREGGGRQLDRDCLHECALVAVFMHVPPCVRLGLCLFGHREIRTV